MKKNTLIIISVLFVFSVLFAISTALLINEDFAAIFSQNASSQPLTVIVDAGHGGEDGGAVAADDTLEKGINLQIALTLEKILKLYGFDVIMTRTTDIMTCDANLETIRSKKISDIRNRLQIIRENENSVFVSIHQNKFSDPSQKGTQVFYSPKNENSKILANTIQQTVVENLQPQNKRVIKKCGTDIYLLYHAEVPAVLVECGFISNFDELMLLKSEDYQMKLATLIADSILKYSLNG